jgi:hypothetical protein
VAGLSWPTAQALLMVASPKGMAKQDMDAAPRTSSLSPVTEDREKRDCIF